jgi:HK97 family phage major capsid protein
MPDSYGDRRPELERMRAALLDGLFRAELRRRAGDPDALDVMNGLGGDIADLDLRIMDIDGTGTPRAYEKKERARDWYRANTRTRTRITPIETRTYTNQRKVMTQTRVKTEGELRADREKAEQLIRTRTRQMEIENYKRVRDVTALSDSEARDCALRMLDDRDAVRVLPSSSAGDELDGRFRDDAHMARLAIVGEHPDYRSAFQKVMRWHDGTTSGRQMAESAMTEAEHAALLRMQDYGDARRRAQQETVLASGGYVVPPFIDPSLVFSDFESPNDFLRLCTVVDISSNEWKGILSAGKSWGFVTEGSEAGDVSLTGLTQPAIPVYTATAVIPYTVEVGEDFPAFATQFARVLAVGYDELLVSKFTSGSGSNEPTGVLTALAAASPSTLVTSAVNGAFSTVDLSNCWAALATKYRRVASWMANETIANEIRLLGNTGFYTAAVLPTGGAAEVVAGRPFYENSYMPVASTTTGANTRLIIGDWSRMVIVRRTGITVEPIPLLPNVANNRPDGTRALFGRARIGSDVPDPQGFRYQANA